ncbi:MAG: HlyD family efflux transporter periplasmic adaptor subunit, partial [Clostridiales bacterium]|nr:HlyD family efflux transporter periplasmic adaptor subunit [Clostridiales bacterium]
AALSNVDTTTKAYQKAVEAAQDTERSTQKAVADQKDSLLSAQLNSKISGSSQEEIDIKKYKEQIDACVITAPMDGIITSVVLQAGDIYKSGELLTIQDTSKFTVSATVDQYDISDISKDMKAIIKTETTGDTLMQGMVTFVSPVPKSSTPTGTSAGNTTTNNNDYEIKVAIDKGSDRLRIGMTAKTSIVLKEQKNAFVVPYYCLQEDTDGTFYITVMENIGEGNNTASADGKKITIKKVLETDYYTAIEADELVEGMSVLVPTITDDSLQIQ